MKHDSWFNSVPMIEDYLGDFVHPPEGVESTNPIDVWSNFKENDYFIYLFLFLVIITRNGC